MNNDDIQAALLTIARKNMEIETLEERGMDALDFHEVGIWGVRDALEAAYRLGRLAVLSESLTGGLLNPHRPAA